MFVCETIAGNYFFQHENILCKSLPRSKCWNSAYLYSINLCKSFYSFIHCILVSFAVLFANNPPGDHFAFVCFTFFEVCVHFFFLSFFHFFPLLRLLCNLIIESFAP